MKPAVSAHGRHGLFLLLPLLILGIADSPAAAPSADLGARIASGFARPTSSHRMLKIIHGWPDDPARQDALRASLLQQGFGGIVCNVSFDSYLESESRWGSFVRAVQLAKQDGLTLWLYDEKGYPSGNAGGLVLRDHPEWEAEGLLVADTRCGEGAMTLELPPGEFVVAAALPLDEPARSQSTGSRGWLEIPQPTKRTLHWTAPPGRWQVAAITRSRLFEGTHAEGNLWQKLPYPNLLNPDPTRRFLELTHARYAKHLGPNLGRWFEATFTDEPSLMSLFLRRMPWRPLPWAPNLPAEFQRRRGYELAPVIPDLVFTGASPASARHRHDYWRTIGDLVSEHFFGQIQTWCRQHGLASGGHLLAEERLVEHVPLYGDLFRCLRRLDAPSLDCLTSLPADVPWHVARLVASAAELDGRPLVMCETSDHAQVWRAPDDPRPKRRVSEAEIRGTVNRLLVAGVNVITSYYSFDGLDDAALRRLNDWVGRAATLLRGSPPVAPVALVYPAESLATHFIPARHWSSASPQANRIDHLYRAALDSLFENRRDVSIIDSLTLAEARVEDGALVQGRFRWPVVILPAVDTLPLAAWRNLERFVERGGLVLALGATPANGDTEFPSPAVLRLARRLFAGPRDEAYVTSVDQGHTAFLPAGTEPLLPSLLDQALPADFHVADPKSPLRATRRRLGDLEFCFLINDSRSSWSGPITLPSKSPATQWDLASGETRAVPASATDSQVINLEPYGAAAFTFPASGTLARRPLRPGPIPVPALIPIPHADPLESHGEFVRGTLTRDEACSAEGRPAWRVAAELTRSQVDTFLFVRLPLNPPSALANAVLLELETWVPDGQATSTGLLVILHEQGGADYLVETTRPLDTPGYLRHFIPLDRFRLAGWSTDANDQLDPDQIGEIRVGWGGYYGTEQERVEFTLRTPRLTRLVRP